MCVTIYTVVCIMTNEVLALKLHISLVKIFPNKKVKHYCFLDFLFVVFFVRFSLGQNVCLTRFDYSDSACTAISTICFVTEEVFVAALSSCIHFFHLARLFFFFYFNFFIIFLSFGFFRYDTQLQSCDGSVKVGVRLGGWALWWWRYSFQIHRILCCCVFAEKAEGIKQFQVAH